MTRLTRRQILAAGSGLAAAGLLRPKSAEAAPALLTAGRRSIEVNGRAAEVFRLTGADGRPGLVLDPGARFAVTLANRTGAPTIIHWHGQTPPPAEDGVAETGYVGPLADGDTRDYDFAARPGTHWMHSHHGLQEQRLLAAPLVVRTPADMALDAQEVVVLLQDFSFRSPEEILAGLVGGGGMAHGGGHAAAGAGPTMSAEAMDGGAMAGHAMPGHDMGGHGMAGGSAAPAGDGGHAGHAAAAPMPAGGGMGGAMLDLNDVAYDAFLANDRTLADPEVVRVERGGRVLLRLINAASASAFWIDLGGLEATVLAVDGNAVAPVTGSRFPLAQAQRLDLLVTLPEAGAYPLLAQLEGSTRRTGLVLATPQSPVSRLAPDGDKSAPPVDLSLERRLRAAAPLAGRAADVVHRVVLGGGMAPYVWSLDERAWPQRRPLPVRNGRRVALDLVNDTGMAHPMHLHGHHFQVVAIDGAGFAGAVRDTVLVPARGTVRIAFDADNPGRWLFHCHNLYHMATGMMTEVVYQAG